MNTVVPAPPSPSTHTRPAAGSSAPTRRPPSADAAAVRRSRAGSNRRLLLLVLLVALAIGGGFLYYWLNRTVAEVARVQRGTAISAVYGTVKVDWVMQQNLKAENTGYIDLAEGLYGGPTSQGFAVKAGQLLGTIRDEATQRQLNQALTEQAAAAARMKAGPGSLEALRSAEDRLARLEKAGSAIVPEADRTAARNTVLQLRTQVENEKVELQRQVDIYAQNVKTAQDILEKSKVISPLDGYVVAAPTINHELVFQNNVLFTIAAKDLYVSGQVNEEDVGDLREGMKAALKLYAFGSREYQATLAAVLPSGDTTNSRYTVFLNPDAPIEGLKAGMTGEMNILVGKHPGAVIMPARALRDPDKSGDRVWVVVDGVVKPRTVKIGYKNPETVEILDGLKIGDAVVVSDLDLFSIGQRVRPVDIDAHKLAEK